MGRLTDSWHMNDSDALRDRWMMNDHSVPQDWSPFPERSRTVMPL